jgi:hypothetical protein
MLKAKIGDGGARSKILFYDFCEAKRNKTENNSKNLAQRFHDRRE